MPTPAAASLEAGLIGRHLPALDGVRALAILTVLVHQFLQFEPQPGIVAAGLNFAVKHGSAGVTLFFVLSGFLITRNLFSLREARGRYVTFYGRRILRIFPIYYAVVAVVFILLPQHFSAREQLPVWFFISNWTEPFPPGPGPLPHFWSLAVEEQFYLLWPLVVFHSSRRQLLWACGAVALVAIVSRILLIHWDFPALAVYTFSVTRMDALAFGSAAAAWLQTPAALTSLLRHRRRLWVAAVGFLLCHAVVAVALKGWAPQYVPVSYYTMVALMWSAFVLAAISGDCTPSWPWHRVLISRPMRLIGKYSYAMYALHVPVALLASHALLRWLNGDGPVGIPVAIEQLVILSAIVFVAAWACYVLFEAYFLRLRDVWFAMPPGKQL